MFIVALLSLFVVDFARGQKLSVEQEVCDPAKIQTKKIKTWKQFNQQYQNKWQVKWNTVTGTPHRISGYYLLINEKLTKDNIETVSRSILTQYQKLLQVEPQNIVLSRADFDPPKMPRPGVTGSWYIAYKQQFQGILVYGGSVRMVIKNGKLVSMGSDYYPSIKLKTDPAITEKEALEIIGKDLGLRRKIKARAVSLVICPKHTKKGVRYHLAYMVEMPRVKDPTFEPLRIRGKEIIPDEPFKSWVYFIDAYNGRIIRRFNAYDYNDLSGQVSGMIYETTPDHSRVERPIAHEEIHIRQGLTDEVVTTDGSGDYSYNGSLTGTVEVEARFSGPHVRVHNEETSDPDATHLFSTTLPGIHDWNWSADDPSPDKVETNAFFHVNLIHDWFMRGDPFDMEPLPHPMEVYVRDGEYCNAGADGTGLRFGSGSPSGCLDFALGADIIYHEFTHRVVRRVYGLMGVDLDDNPFKGAMNEGWADYFGASITNDSWHGEVIYGGRNVDTGEYMWDVPVDENRRFPRDWVGEVHWDGLIFSGAIWDVRKTLGDAETDSLAFRALKHAPEDFSEYLYAILLEDDDPAYVTDPTADNDLSNGTPNIDAICRNFYDFHGIFQEQCLSHTDHPVAVISSPDPLTFTPFDPSVPSISIIGTAAGSSNPLRNFTLDYGEGEEPSSWLSTGFSLTDDGILPVTDATLAVWDLAGIGDGPYTIRLTVTDSAGHTSQTFTKVFVDRLIMAGWPVEPAVHFYSSPAVADIDPAYPGLEIAAAGDDGYLHVWHADGTDAPDWPKRLGYTTKSSPAVGDIDNDGDLEIVIGRGNYQVSAFQHDGSNVSGWPRGTPDLVYATPALADLDGDGDLEVVVGSLNGKVYAWHHDGTEVSGWPKTTGDEVWSSAAIGDIDGDDDLEIVAGSNDNNVYAWHHDGTEVSGWPIDTGGEVGSSPVLGDIDNDGCLEVIAAAWPAGNVYAWHHDGTLVAGWPGEALAAYPSSPVLADLDGDGSLEVIVMANNDIIHIWHGDGTPVDHWPPEDSPGADGSELFVSSPVIGDLDGDGDLELIAEESGRFSRVSAFHHDGTQFAGWPRYVSSYSNSSPILADLDQDGDLEIVVGSDGLFVWDLPGAYSEKAMQWPCYRHDIQRTGAHGPRAGVALLFDTSGSMSWAHDGTRGVPTDEQRLALAQSAAIPFMEMLYDYNAGKANFGIATFPTHPWTSLTECGGQIITPMNLVTDSSTTEATTITIPGLAAEGDTPLLAGLDRAMEMLGPERNQAVVLLSDGYHNCPSIVSAGDPQVTELIDRLNSGSIKVFTIGFARPADADHPLLASLAEGTGGQFYDVTGPAFEPGTWHPGTDLQATYKAILVDALELESAADPMGIIKANEKISREVSINEHDRTVSFYLSWVRPMKKGLALTIRSSDGEAVPLTLPMTGVHFHQGKTYKIVTVDRSFLRLPAKVGAASWKIEIDTDRLESGEKEHYQYSVIMDSGLKMETGFDKKSYRTGQPITIRVKISEAGGLPTGPVDIHAEVTRPEEGIGNWYAAHKVGSEELLKIPGRQGDEHLSPLQRKALFLADVRKVSFPARTKPVTLKLHDDGTGGDAIANDGIHTIRFIDTKKEGTYSFRIRAMGTTKGGNAFTRDDIIQKYLTVNIASGYIDVEVDHLPSVNKQEKQFRVTVIPKDPLGNYLGPGYSGAVTLIASKGRFIGKTEDNLDGTYSRALRLPISFDIKKINISVEVKGIRFSFNLANMMKRSDPASAHGRVLRLPSEVSKTDSIITSPRPVNKKGNTSKGGMK